MLRSLPKFSIIFSSTKNSRYLSNATQRFISSGRTRRIITRPTSRVKIVVTTAVPIRCMSTAADDQVQRVKVLTSTDDKYGGVIVELDQPMDSTTFVSILRASILHWKQMGKKGVWIKLPIHLVGLAEGLVKVTLLLTISILAMYQFYAFTILSMTGRFLVSPCRTKVFDACVLDS